MESIAQRGRVSQPIHDAKGRKVGEVRAGVFRKDRLKGSKHMLRKPPAWGFDIASLDEAEAHGADCVLVTDIESGKQYYATIQLIRNRGIHIDRGFGNQICLPLGYFSVNGRKPQEKPRDEAKDKAQQIPLFEGLR